MLRRENPKQQKRENEQKVYVEVLLHNTMDGLLLPFKFKTDWDDKFFIDKVVNIEPAASFKAGGQGIRYTCQVVVLSTDDHIFAHAIDLYHDGDFWFVEYEQLCTLVSCA